MLIFDYKFIEFVVIDTQIKTINKFLNKKD